MDKPIKVLLLEDREDDALLIVRALRQSGFQVTYERVETEADFRRQLTNQVDLILSDYSLPQINGLKALEIVQALELDIPFIIITGTLEEMALECMRQGAADYLLKDRLSRLGEAVRHALEEKKLEQAEREQRNLAQALQEVASIINRTLDLETVYKNILEMVGRVVPHDGANIMLVESGVAEIVDYRLASQQDDISEEVVGHQFEIDKTLNLKAMVHSQRPFIVPDVNEFESWLAIPETSWVASCLGAPIIREQEVLGFLHLDSARANFFTPQHAERLQAFADQVALGIHNAFLYEELEAYNRMLAQMVDERTTELKQALTRSNAILHNSPEGIILLTADAKIEMSNRAFHSLFGYASDEIYGETPDVLFVEDSKPAFRQAIAETIELRKATYLECIARRHDGKTFDIDVGLAPILEKGTLMGIVCSLRDISKLKEVARLKDNFVSNVSHELRTPIANLKLHHDLIAMQPAKLDDYLGRMEREIDRLIFIVEDLLRLSRLEQGRTPFNRVDVDINDLAAQYVMDRVSLAESKNKELRLQLSPQPVNVIADPRLLGQVLSILLTNALNYTPEGSHITVHAALRQKEEKTWGGFVVMDTGKGISPEDLPHLFERFYRGEAGRESGEAGTGLGLSIAEEIVKRHNGRIEVENNQNGPGAAFSVWLPQK